MIASNSNILFQGTTFKCHVTWCVLDVCCLVLFVCFKHELHHLIKDQEEEDKAQFVFLSEPSGEGRWDVHGAHPTGWLDQAHEKALSVGEDLTGDLAGQHGPQPDEPTMLAVEPAGDGASRSPSRMSPIWSRTFWPGLAVKEVAQLFDLLPWKSTSLYFWPRNMFL